MSNEAVIVGDELAVRRVWPIAHMYGDGRVWTTPDGQTNMFLGMWWSGARQHETVVAFESQQRSAEPMLCLNCSQPIKQCSPWGWHHEDGPVLCYNESEMVATPREHRSAGESEGKATCDEQICRARHVGENLSAEPWRGGYIVCDINRNGWPAVDGAAAGHTKEAAWSVLREIEDDKAASKPVATSSGKGFDWVACPVCGEPDMRKEFEGDEGDAYIYCTNLACVSNGGTNHAALSAAPAPEVTWRVEREGQAGMVSVDGSSREEDARAYYADLLARQDELKFHGTISLVKIETTETIVSVRRREY